MARNTAIRTFASEFNQATHIYKDGDDQQSPKFQVLPTGEQANRVLIAGTLFEVNDVGSDETYLQAHIVDTAGDSVYCYAGQYQPDAMAVLQNADLPEFIAVIGKPSAYETDEGETRVNIKPEDIAIIDKETRNTYAVEAAEHSLERLEEFDAEEDGSDASFATSAYGEETVGQVHEQVRQSSIRALESVLENEDGEAESEESEAVESEAVDGEMGVTREQLQQFDHQELRGFAASIDDVNGNSAYEDLVDALAGRDLNIPVASSGGSEASA
jgi:RPA family protein